MRNAEKTKKNEEEREKEGEGGTEEEKEHQDTIKQASRKSGYTICVKNKLGIAFLGVEGIHFSHPKQSKKSRLILWDES